MYVNIGLQVTDSGIVNTASPGISRQNGHFVSCGAAISWPHPAGL